MCYTIGYQYILEVRSMGALIVIALLAVAALVWGCIRLSIWIIKTAIKEALQEYDAQKNGQS